MVLVCMGGGIAQRAERVHGIEGLLTAPFEAAIDALRLIDDAVVRAAPDGYTLLLAVNSDAINATLYDKLNFNFIRDIAPVAGIIRASFVMVVNPSFPATTVPEFIAYAKANLGKVNMASGGVGSGNHLSGELFKIMAGVNMIHVPYRGEAPALVDVL